MPEKARVEQNVPERSSFRVERSTVGRKEREVGTGRVAVNIDVREKGGVEVKAPVEENRRVLRNAAVPGKIAEGEKVGVRTGSGRRRRNGSARKWLFA